MLLMVLVFKPVANDFIARNRRCVALIGILFAFHFILELAVVAVVARHTAAVFIFHDYCFFLS